jgi:CRISPR-associated protein Csd2
MCANFFDVRGFGAVMSTGINCGQVRGPIQMTFARSVEPIVAGAFDHPHGRRHRSRSRKAGWRQPHHGPQAHRPLRPLSRARLHLGLPGKANRLWRNDLELFWQALGQMFEHDRSAARGQMATRGLYVFEHDSELGNAPAHALFERLTVERQGDGVARDFAAYSVLFDGKPIATGEAIDVAPGVRLRRLA